MIGSCFGGEWLIPNNNLVIMNKTKPALEVPPTNLDLLDNNSWITEFKEEQGPNKILHTNPALSPMGIQNENTSEERTLYTDQFGFTVDLGANPTIFNEIPTPEINIFNTTFLMNNTIFFRFLNESIESEWIEFKVLDNVYITDWKMTLKAWCEYTAPDHYVQYEFRSNTTESPSQIFYYQLFRDVKEPEYNLGIAVVNEILIPPSDWNTPWFNEQPYFYVEVWDNYNLNQTIEIHYTMLNKEYRVKAPIYAQVGVARAYGIIKVEISNFHLAPEGENSIAVFIEDGAGNLGDTLLFEFIKDTKPPEISDPTENNDWIKYEGQPLYETKKSLFGYYEIIPIGNSTEISLTFYFNEDMIRDVTTSIRYRKTLLEMTYSNSNSSNGNLPDYLNVFNDIYMIREIPAYKLNSSVWKVVIDLETWAAIENRECYLDIEVMDLAKNTASYSIQIFNPPMSTLNIWNTRIIYLSTLILVLASIIIYLFMQIVPSRHAIFLPFAHLSPDEKAIIDVAISPIELEKISRLERFIDRFIVKVDVEKITPFDLHEFINEPIQIINEQEILTLLNQYKMDPYQQEEFIREMLLLTPEEREKFLQVYMDELDADGDEDDLFIDEKVPDFEDEEFGEKGSSS